MTLEQPKIPPSLNIIPSLTDTTPSLLNDIFTQKLIVGEHNYPSNLISLETFNPRLLPITDIISPPTSDDESFQNNQVTFTEVCNYFFDEKILRVVESVKEIESRKPAILLINLNSDITAKDISDNLGKNDHHITPTEVIISTMETDDKEKFIYAVCKFENKFQCEYVYNINKGDNQNRMKLCYDGTDVSSSEWYAVIIRNIPYVNRFNFEEVYCSKFNESIKYTKPVTKIGGILCCMIVMNSIEAAENICKELNRKDGLKAHLHYKCCKQRKGKENKRLRFGNGKKKDNKKKKPNVIGMLLNEQKKREKSKNI